MKICFFSIFFQILIVWEQQLCSSLACDNKVTNQPTFVYAKTTLLNYPWNKFRHIYLCNSVTWKLDKFSGGSLIKHWGCMHTKSGASKLNKRELCHRHQYGILNSYLARHFTTIAQPAFLVLQITHLSDMVRVGLYIWVFSLLGVVEKCCIRNTVSSTVYVI